jgi:hypothetical protein
MSPRFRIIRWTKKQSLPPIGITGPFVEDQHARKIMEVLHFSQLFVRQKIMQRQQTGVSRIAGAELQTCAARGP